MSSKPWALWRTDTRVRTAALPHFLVWSLDPGPRPDGTYSTFTWLTRLVGDE